MEVGDQERNSTEQQHEEQHIRKKGSFKAIPFIIANESFEKVASYGLLPNMILYLMKEYNMSLAKGQNMIFLWTSATNFFPLVGAFIADSYLGRFLTIGIGSIFSLLGMSLLWMTTVVPNARPKACNALENEHCEAPNTGQYALLALAFLIMSIGAGGVRPCSLAFGADQIDQRDNNNPKNRKILETFFNWYYACGCFSVVIAMTVIVYIQDHLGWRIGFGIPLILMCLSTISLFCATPLYIMHKVKGSLFTSLVRVVVASFRNRKLKLPPQGQWYTSKDSAMIFPTDRLRWLNKACIIQDTNGDITPNGSPKNPWKLCTVDEVEELKALIRALPIWSAGVIMNIHANQTSFGVIQALTMDRHLGPNFEIPAASFMTIQIMVIVLWIPLYDRILLPLTSKIYGKPVSLDVKMRMGIGIFCAFLSMFVAGVVEFIRRNHASTKISALWLIPQNIFTGLAEALNAIGQNEFFYTEMPRRMSSIATCLNGVGLGVAALLSSVILNLVNHTTQRGGKESWVSSNVNKGHFDYYYWLIAFICFFNVVYYMFCCWCYGPVEQGKKVIHEEMTTTRSISK